VEAHELMIHYAAIRCSHQRTTGPAVQPAESCHAPASLILYTVCVNTPNGFCLMHCDVMNYHDVTSATNFVFAENVRFADV